NAFIPADLLATAGTARITVKTADTVAGPLTFTVLNPKPFVAIGSPAVVAKQDYTLTVTGNNFVNGATVVLAGTPCATTFVSSTKLTAFIPGSLLVHGTAPTYLVANPEPSEGPSNVSDPIGIGSGDPVITSISPATVVAGSGDVQVTIDGAGFLDGDTQI